MSPRAKLILEFLAVVDAERARRARTPGLLQKVEALKVYQQRRFMLTYDDLLRSTRYGAAARFFVEELYGPGDFSRRDAEFARIVPALVKLFPSEVVDVVAALAELHALSESLDTRLGEQLMTDNVAARDYLAAWQRGSRPDERQRQLELSLDVARRLDQLTRKPLLRNTLRLMRVPARRAGLGELQRFLERGFDTFQLLRGADEFVAVIKARETTLARALFAAELHLPSELQSVQAARELLP